MSTPAQDLARAVIHDFRPGPNGGGIISMCFACGDGELAQQHTRRCGRIHYGECCAHGGHCWHETNRYTERSVSPGRLEARGSMVKTESCCFCGDSQSLFFDLVPATGHGPHAPPGVWSPLVAPDKGRMIGGVKDRTRA